jgi:hypothetical protein
MSDKKHVHILSELYAHPIAHNIKWQELIPALTSIGFVPTDRNDGSHFMRNGHTIALGHNNTTVSIEEILTLRHFIATSAKSKNKTPDLADDIIVAVNHRQAIIFHDLGTELESTSKEYADLTKSRVLHKRPTSPPFSNVGPDIDDDYYDGMIKEMSNAKRIVILSHGTGASNAASQLMSKISERDPEVAHRVAAIQRCDLEAMTEPQMLSLGKQLFSPERAH